MKASFQQLKSSCPQVPDSDIHDFLNQATQRYTAFFSLNDQCQHLVKLSAISATHPFELILRQADQGRVECTVISFNYPFLFMTLTGILASMGFDVAAGEIFTFRAVPQNLSVRSLLQRRSLGREAVLPAASKRKIVDYFAGTIDTPYSFLKWRTELEERLRDIIQLLEEGSEESFMVAKRRVNRMVAKRLWELKRTRQPVLYPIKIHIDNKTDCTRVRIVSEDTPFFLYSLASALALHDLSIEHVHINTTGSRVEDEIYLVDRAGQKLTDATELDRLKLSVMLTKQFTYFIDQSPSPYNALERFGQLVQDVLKRSRPGQLMAMFSDPHVLKDMARLLGTSDFLWEDFIRVQYETLLPMLKDDPAQVFTFEKSKRFYTRQLDEVLSGISSFEEKKTRLNDFKNKMLYRIDLAHILGEIDFRAFAAELTLLAEVVVCRSVVLVYEELVRQYGTPMTVAEMEAPFAIFGLGKFGGAALGYASDIELMVIYSDSGATSGRMSVSNSEFFDKLVRELNLFIQSKADGIFQLDFRLRPHGDSGPLAVSLESFGSYYGPGGHSLFYERLSLVRLRYIYGDKRFARKVERLRDEFVYRPFDADSEEFWKLRRKQAESKQALKSDNAKFSPGALVDIEYAVQILQVRFGRRTVQLRTPKIHKALSRLAEAGIMTEEESCRLIDAYDFFRRLINGLRMLRGSAKDLFLPVPGTNEYEHLARRIGYGREGDLNPSKNLKMDFDTYTAYVKQFIEKYFSRDSLAAEEAANVADLILMSTVSDKARDSLLTVCGFKNPAKAYHNLKCLSETNFGKEKFARVAVLACDWLSDKPDPDQALNHWERFVRNVPSPADHFSLILSQPKRLDILLDIFSVSHFLSELLIREPKYFNWVTSLQHLYKRTKRGKLYEEVSRLSRRYKTNEEWWRNIRRFRKREILRIAIRDFVLQVPLQDVTVDLSVLAEAIIQQELTRTWERVAESGKYAHLPLEVLADHFCILAFGKLGATELNYSSDVDLVAVYDGEATAKTGADMFEIERLYTEVLTTFDNDLSAHTDEGLAYRIDFNLRPFGGVGSIISSAEQMLRYYLERASLWEVQAMIKMRPVAGNWGLGFSLLHELRPVLFTGEEPETIIANIRQLRVRAIQQYSRKRFSGIDIKNGRGGIRDIEFFLQGFQMIYSRQFPRLFVRNTINGLMVLKRLELIPEQHVDILLHYYTFFRRIEHFLQILEDRQTHSLPTDEHELGILARRLLGKAATAEGLLEQVKAGMETVFSIYNDYLVYPQKEAQHEKI